MQICMNCKEEMETGDRPMPASIRISTEELNCVIAALQRPDESGNNEDSVKEHVRRIKIQTAAGPAQVQDLLTLIDRRVINTIFYKMGIWSDLQLLTRTYYRRPAQKGAEVVGYGSLSSTGVACFFSWLERLGFSRAFGNAAIELAPPIPEGALITAEQLYIMDFVANRDSMKPVTLYSSENITAKHQVEKFTTKDENIVLIKRNRDKIPFELKVKAARLKEHHL